MYSVCYATDGKRVELHEDVVTEVSKAFIYFYLYYADDEYRKYIHVVSEMDVGELLESDSITAFYCFYAAPYSVFVFNDAHMEQSEVVKVFKQKTSKYIDEDTIRKIIHGTDIVVLYTEDV